MHHAQRSFSHANGKEALVNVHMPQKKTKKGRHMDISPEWKRLVAHPDGSAHSQGSSLSAHEYTRRRKLAQIILLVIASFQMVEIPGALVNHNLMALGTALLGATICAVALFFNQRGMVTVGSILLIIVVDLGCGLMLLTSPNGLAVENLPIFDALIISDLIAVSLLPARSVFPVALGNILFIIGDLILQPQTPAMQKLLASGMASTVLIQPISLQIIVAIVTYLWVRSAQQAIVRADRAEEIAALQRREAERTQQLEAGIQQLLQTQVRTANGDLTARVNLRQENVLWQVGVSLNLLLTRLQKAERTTRELQQMRSEVTRLTEALHVLRSEKCQCTGEEGKARYGANASSMFLEHVERLHN